MLCSPLDCKTVFLTSRSVRGGTDRVGTESPAWKVWCPKYYIIFIFSLYIDIMIIFNSETVRPGERLRFGVRQGAKTRLEGRTIHYSTSDVVPLLSLQPTEIRSMDRNDAHLSKASHSSSTKRPYYRGGGDLTGPGSSGPTSGETTLSRAARGGEKA